MAHITTQIQLKLEEKMQNGIAELAADHIDKISIVLKKVYGRIDTAIKIELRDNYKIYLEKTKSKYSQSRSFFVRDMAVNLYDYYVPLGLANQNHSIETPEFLDCIEISKHLVISGQGGSGKSILMRHLFLDCLRSGLFVPILVELRDLNSEEDELLKLIIKQLDQFGLTISIDFAEKAMQHGHFAFFLDGYDEVNKSIRKKLLRDIKGIVRKYDSCPLIISTRPEDTLKGIDELCGAFIQPLNKDKAVELIKKLPFDQRIKSRFVDGLQNDLFEKHESFLSNPLLLSIMLITYGENADIPSKLSLFYNQAYETLFQRHDAKKGGYKRERLTDLDIQDFAKVFSVFSVQTYEKRLFRMSKSSAIKFVEHSRSYLGFNFRPEEYLTDLLDAACLLIEDGLDIAYSHRSFQEFFVAKFIIQSPPEIQKQMISKCWENSINDNVINLLVEMDSGLIERFLLIPKLEKLYSDLGFKREIGITHAAKYVKNTYKYIELRDDEIVAVFDGFRPSAGPLIHMAIILAGESIPYSKTKHLDFINSIREQFGSEFRFETKKMTYRTPFLAYVLNSECFLSAKFLSKGFSALKAIKARQNRSSRDFSLLLGIESS